MVAERDSGEPVMTFAEAAGWLEQRFGRRPNVATIWRWAVRGLRGVRLQTIALGRYRFTTERAIKQFIDQTSAVIPRHEDNHSPSADPLSGQPFTEGERSTAIRRRTAEKEKAKQFLRQNLGVSGRQFGGEPQTTPNN